MKSQQNLTLYFINLSVFAGIDPGDLDQSFGVHGIVATDLQVYYAIANAIAIQPDRKIVVAGAAGYYYHFAVVRYNPDGSLDNSFGNNGFVQTDFGMDYDSIAGLKIQANGKIVVAGPTDVGPNPQNFALARYNSDGSIDKTFNPSGAVSGKPGLVITDFGLSDVANGVAIQTDGKIIAAGTALNGGAFALARYNIDGSLDISFGNDGNGKVITDFGIGSDNGNAVTIQQNGKIIVAGQTGIGPTASNFALARYDIDGRLDTSFNPTGAISGQPGLVVIDFGTGGERIRAVAIQAKGKIVAAGITNTGPNPQNFALARFNIDGSLDTSFGIEGKVITDFNNTSEQANGLLVQVDGKLVVVGRTDNISNFGTSLAIVRYNVDGVLDTTFGSSGTGAVVIELSGYGGESSSVALQSDGKIVSAGSGPSNTNPYSFLLARYLSGVQTSKVAQAIFGKYVNN